MHVATGYLPSFFAFLDLTACLPWTHDKKHVMHVAEASDQLSSPSWADGSPFLNPQNNAATLVVHAWCVGQM